MSDFHGVFPYLASPVDGEGQIRAAVLGRLCEDLIASGVHGLTPLGSTNEFAYLNHAQRAVVVRTTIEAGFMPEYDLVIPGRGKASSPEGITTTGSMDSGLALARAPA